MPVEEFRGVRDGFAGIGRIAEIANDGTKVALIRLEMYFCGMFQLFGIIVQ